MRHFARPGEKKTLCGYGPLADLLKNRDETMCRVCLQIAGLDLDHIDHQSLAEIGHGSYGLRVTGGIYLDGGPER